MADSSAIVKPQRALSVFTSTGSKPRCSSSAKPGSCMSVPCAAVLRAGETGSGPLLRLLIVGDSAAAGVGVARQHDALAGHLSRALAAKCGARVQWHLLARSGVTSAQCLQMLEDEGLISEAEAEGSRKPFAVTESGIEELDSRADEVDVLMDRLSQNNRKRQRVRSPDLFRAMGNLASVLKNRAKEGKLDKATIDKIVDIIDEVAKRIERL